MRGKNLYFALIRIVFILLFFINYTSAYAQDNIKITGVVLDAESKKTIEYVNISVLNNPGGTTSDKEGKFEIKIENKDKAKIIFSHINYFKYELNIKNLNSLENITIYLRPKTEQLQDVVISASLYEKPVYKLSKQVSIISNRQIADNMNSNLTDMLASTPGFSQIWEYHSPILLRGMNSKRIIIMKNGNRRVGTFPGGYFGQDMNIYDTKKVEIIKGPGSVIYGSGAISGIINIISQDLLGEKSTNARIMSGYGTNNNEFLEVARVCHKSENFGIAINGKYRKTDDYVYGNGETAENSDVEDRDFSLNSAIKLSEKHKLKINADYHYGDWGKPRGFNGPTKNFTKIRNLEEQYHTDLNYEYAPKGFVENITLNLYYDQGTRDYYKYKFNEITANLSGLDLVHYKDNYGGGQLYTTLNLSEKNKLTAGVDGYLFLLDNPTEIFDYYYDTQGNVEGYKNAGQQTYGAFINEDWEISKKFHFITGIRYDNAQVKSGTISNMPEVKENRTAFSGNVGLVYSSKENTNISLNFGRAFRMPNSEELFAETISCKGIKLGNPNLEPEYSWNIDLGFRGHSKDNKLKYDIAVFYNHLDGFINETTDTVNENVDFTYKNTDAEIYGGEFSTSYQFNHVFKPKDKLYIGTGGSYLYGIDLYGNEKNSLFGIPPLKLLANVKYYGQINAKWITGYNIKLESEYAAKQNRVADVPEGADPGPWGYETSEAHTVFNFYMGVNSNALPGSPKLRFVVKNILDADYQPFGSYIPAMGINFKTVLIFNL
jgi:outer membrane receptor protein involved in Fe transport